jgi:hypothetical protein
MAIECCAHVLRSLRKWREAGPYGHPDVENLTVSVSGSPEGSYVFAGAVCREGEQRFHYDWLQRDIAPTG